MSNTPDRINPALIPPLQPERAAGASQPTRTADGKSFGDILRTKVSEVAPAAPQQGAAPASPVTVKWSAHAAARLVQRGIQLGESHLARLETAVDKASAKGAREALVMMDGTAMVVSVKNRTVITALGQDQAKNNVFTNIDAAVIA